MGDDGGGSSSAHGGGGGGGGDCGRGNSDGDAVVYDNQQFLLHDCY